MNICILCAFLAVTGSLFAGQDVEPMVIDRMGPLMGHDTGSLAAPLCESPSRLIAVRKVCGYGEGSDLGHGLRVVVYLEPSEEDPEGMPGRCAYCFTVRSQTEPLDASAYRFLTFYVRGEAGDERMAVALVDRKNEGTMMQLKGLPVGEYVERKALDSEWQKAKIPLENFGVNLNDLSHILFIYDNRMYENNSSKRIVMYLDELALE